MNAVLRINFYQEMHMFWHHFQFEHIRSRFSTHSLDNLFKAHINPVDQDLATILRTPDNVVFA